MNFYMFYVVCTVCKPLNIRFLMHLKKHQLSVYINVACKCISVAVGGSWNIWREPMLGLGPPVNSMHKSFCSRFKPRTFLLQGNS